jgi:hypothetical protein
MIQLTEMPPSIAALPRDDRGYPVPWFVAWIDGKPEFRCMDPKKFKAAIETDLCWVCGQPLDPKGFKVFVIGPMCVVNRVTSEPPSHEDCAVFSVRNCPFLSKPAAQYRNANLPEAAEAPAGLFIKRNPGVSCLWYVRARYSLMRLSDGYLIRLPGAAQVRFWREGRKATRAEILESIETGLPNLQREADAEGPAAQLALRHAIDNAKRLIPAA